MARLKMCQLYRIGRFIT